MLICFQVLYKFRARSLLQGPSGKIGSQYSKRRRFFTAKAVEESALNLAAWISRRRRACSTKIFQTLVRWALWWQRHDFDKISSSTPCST